MPTLIVGLGNHGGEYAHTRHNAGWMCLDELVRRGRFGREQREGPSRIRTGSLEGYDVVLARPLTYMNLSGRAAHHLTERFGVPPEDVTVVYDDIDLAFGRLRLRRGGGPGGHNGVRSLIASWRTPEFIRVRIGVGRPPQGEDAADHVLRAFTPEERERLPAVIEAAADAAIAILREGLDQAMNVFNRKPDA